MGKVVPTSLSSKSNLETQRKFADDRSRNENATQEQALPNSQAQKDVNLQVDNPESFVQVMATVQQMNQQLEELNKDLIVLINKNRDSYKVIVVDVNTDNIIKEFNPEEFMKMAQNLRNQKLSFLDKDV